MKKIFTLLLSAAMVLCMMPSMAFAAVGETDVAKIGDTGYASLQEAVNKVQKGETIVLLKDVPDGCGVKVTSGKDFTIDFSGFTYTITKELVGSGSKYETNGFQMLKDSEITLKNGTIKAGDNENLGILLQNYCNLTLLDITVDASGASNCDYALSNNFGDTVIDGATNIVAREGETAFDLWYGLDSKGTYDAGVTVTIADTMTGLISGKVEYGTNNSSAEDWETKTALKINGGSFEIDFIPSTSGATNLDGASIVISSGQFSNDEAIPFVAEDRTAASLKSSGVTTYYIGTPNAVAEKVATAKDGDSIAVEKGSIDLNLPEGVTVKNEGEGKVVVNDTLVGKDDTVTPSEPRTMQNPYKHVASDWNNSYGTVEPTANGYILKGVYTEPGNDGGYAVGPFSKIGLQSFGTADMSQEINVAINQNDEESYVNNGVKFALSSALNDSDDENGKYVGEMTYELQKEAAGVRVMGTDILLDKSDIYTFRIEMTKDNAGNAYSQLIVSLRGTEVGRTLKTKINCTDVPKGQRYLWFSSINPKAGVKVYTTIPEYLTLDKTALSLKVDETATLVATIPDFITDAVEWTTSDASIATVANGKVTAVGEGTATITAKINGHEVKCTVTVKTSFGGYIPPSDSLAYDRYIAENAIKNYVDFADYDAAEDAVLKTIIDDAKADIAKAKTKAEIDLIVANAKSDMDKVLTTKEKAELAALEAKKAKVKDSHLKIYSENGKGFIRIKWNPAELGMDYDGVNVYRSTKRTSEFKRISTFKVQTSKKYTKNLKKGTKYYFYVKGYKTIGGEKVYSQKSLTLYRTFR